MHRSLSVGLALLACGLSACQSSPEHGAGAQHDPSTGALPPAPAKHDAAELAKQLSNPLAALISVPLQFNHDTGIGTTDADRTTLNVQPVIPVTVDDDWNAISRTILPLIDADATFEGGEDEAGFGDLLQSVFFSLAATPPSGWVWGVGPALLVPTASTDALGSGKWGLGPTLVVLRQDGGWTYGALTNHLWTIAGESDRSDVNATFLQPFLAYTLQSHTTLTVNSESTYDWTGDQWTVPVNLMVSQVLKIGSLPISLAFGYREYVESPDGGPDWGLRLVLTFLFPK